MTKLEFMVRAFALQNEQLTAMAKEQQTLLASIIEERKKKWVSLTDEEIKDIVGRNDPDGIGRYTRELFAKIEAKLKEKNGWLK